MTVGSRADDVARCPAGNEEDCKQVGSELAWVPIGGGGGGAPG